MNRRTFFQRLLGGIGLVATGTAIGAETRSVLIQESAVAGFQFYEGDFIWPHLAIDARLELAREADNIHDPNAVAVYFHTEQLGYVPRVENTAVAQMLDRGDGYSGGSQSEAPQKEGEPESTALEIGITDDDIPF